MDQKSMSTVLTCTTRDVLGLEQCGADIRVGADWRRIGGGVLTST